MNKKEKILSILLDPLVVPLTKYVVKKNNARQILIEEVLITSEWLEILPDPPLRCTKRSQRIRLVIDDCYMNTESRDWEVFLGNGTIIAPEIEIFDSKGKAYIMEGGNYGYNPEPNSPIGRVSEAGFYFEPGLPKDEVFTKVRIKNAQPFMCGMVYWQDYNMK